MSGYVSGRGAWSMYDGCNGLIASSLTSSADRCIDCFTSVCSLLTFALHEMQCSMYWTW